MSAESKEPLGYIMIYEKYTIVVASYVEPSERIIDISFDELAANNALQKELFGNLVAGRPKDHLAIYLSSFIQDGRHNERREYLMNNGELRICITNKELRDKVKSTISQKK